MLAKFNILCQVYILRPLKEADSRLHNRAFLHEGMQTKIRQIGNSSGILIPASLLAGLGMRKGAKVNLNTDAMAVW